jgi:hypothetical protein
MSVQLFHAQTTAVPAITVLVVGEKKSFSTEIPLGGGGVLLMIGAVPPPLPPHPNKQAIATVVQTCLNILVSTL